MEHVMTGLAALRLRKGGFARRITLVATVAALLLGAGIVPLLSADHAAEARARLVRKTIPVQASCLTPDRDGYCAAAFFVDLSTTRVFKVAFVTDPSASLCSPVDVLFTVRDGTEITG